MPNRTNTTVSWLRDRSRPAIMALVASAAALFPLCVVGVGPGGGPAQAAAATTPTVAPTSGTVALIGHGYGHGHGMGQWGALGYAVDQTPYQSILDHYYGGTQVATLSSGQEATQVRVDLTENDGNQVIVTSSSAFTVAGKTVPAGQAADMVQTSSSGSAGTWTVNIGPGCAGPWTQAATGVSGPTAVPANNPPLGAADTATDALQVCLVGGNLTVRGNIEATESSDGSPRTVNIVPLEEYVADVVPSESPSSWGTLGGSGPQGQAWGFQELEAQAVAARSYMMASPGSYGGYADTCDQTCQTYPGIKNESALADLAVADTAGQVMEFPGGTIAATQYSASTGGYTNPGAAGVGFPAVVDTGDSICIPGACNPNHDWTASVPVSAIEAAWPQLGTYEGLSITARNGYGDWGGRVTAMTLMGTSQNVQLTGDAFAAGVNLKSDWFTTTTAAVTLNKPVVGMASTPDGKGYWLVASDGGIFAYGDATFYGSTGSMTLNKPVVGMASTPDGKGYWLVASDGGIFAYGDATFYGSTGSMTLNKPVVGMASTPDGKGYWLVASDGGIFAYGDATFYGSTGSMTLNKPVVGMAATPDGKGYWLVASDGGIFSYGDATFYGSTGSMTLNKPVVGMASTPDGKGYWLVASDGGIFAYGDAQFYGSTGNLTLNEPVVGMASTPDGKGYWFVASDGGIFSYGDATFYGSTG